LTSGGSSGGDLGDYGGWEKRTTREEKTAAAKALREQRGLVGGAASARSRHSSLSLSRDRDLGFGGGRRVSVG
jgi:hypothetical protein